MSGSGPLLWATSLSTTRACDQKSNMLMDALKHDAERVCMRCAVVWLTRSGHVDSSGGCRFMKDSISTRLKAISVFMKANAHHLRGAILSHVVEWFHAYTDIHGRHPTSGIRFASTSKKLKDGVSDPFTVVHRIRLFGHISRRSPKAVDSSDPCESEHRSDSSDCTWSSESEVQSAWSESESESDDYIY
jgi:hypothetical protein